MMNSEAKSSHEERSLDSLKAARLRDDNVTKKRTRRQDRECFDADSSQKARKDPAPGVIRLALIESGYLEQSSSEIT